MSSNTQLTPTYVGYIHSTLDALLVIEACLVGARNHVPRRPQDRERQELIKSGNVFIYEEHASGIKRWTDGVSWSPSRILDNFLVYRELEKPFGPGEKKRALKKPKKPTNGITKETRGGSEAARDEDRALIGSLVDSYDFKQSGLVKKTITVTYQGVPHHLVSYYSCEDVKAGRLQCPSQHAELRTLVPRSELLMSQNFRAPIDGSADNTDRVGGGGGQMLVDYNYQPVPPMLANNGYYYYQQQSQLPPIHMQQQQLQQHHHQHHQQHHPQQHHHHQQEQQREQQQMQQMMSMTQISQHMHQQQQQQYHQQQQQQQEQLQQQQQQQQEAYVTMPSNPHLSLSSFSYAPDISGIDTSLYK